MDNRNVSPTQSPSSSLTTRRMESTSSSSHEWHNLHSKDNKSSNGTSSSNNETASSSEEGGNDDRHHHHHHLHHHVLANHHASHSSPSSIPPTTNPLSESATRRTDDNSTRRNRVASSSNGRGTVLVEDPAGGSSSTRGTAFSSTSNNIINNNHTDNNNSRRHDGARKRLPKSLLVGEPTEESVDSASSSGGDGGSSSSNNVIRRGGGGPANVSNSSGRDSSGSGGGGGGGGTGDGGATNSSSGDDHDHDSSGGGNGSGSASGSGSGSNALTGTTATNASSGDDRDSSGGGHGSGGDNSRGTLESSGGLLASNVGFHHHLHHVHHHGHHRSSHYRRHSINTNGVGVGSVVVKSNLDGSALRLGPASMSPATVVASRLSAPNADGTSTTSSSGSGGEGGETLTNQDMFESLLQLHKHKPDYHTIKRTFSKLPSRRGGGDSKKGSTAATDSSAEEMGASTRKKGKSKHHSLKPSSSIATADNINNSTTSSSLLPTKMIMMKNKVNSSSSPSGGCGEDAMVKPKMKSTRKKMMLPPRAQTSSPSLESSDDSNQEDNCGGGGSLSGSGTEGGYAASSSSNDIGGTQASCCSSPSESSSEESTAGPSTTMKKSKRHRSSHYGHGGEEMIGSKRSKLPKNVPQNISSHFTKGGYLSSEIADFSSGASDDSFEGGSTINTCTSASPSLSSSNEGEGLPYDMRLEEMQAMVDQARMLRAAAKRGSKIVKPLPLSSLMLTRHRIGPTKADYGRLKDENNMRSSASSSAAWRGTPAILSLGSDVMAHVLTFLEPPVILNVLTMPLCKVWRRNFTCQPELWRVLCLVEPFKAKIDDDDDSSSSDSFTSLQDENDHSNNKLLSRYRLLYSSFVRCMRYLSQIKDDALHGRAPSFIDYGLAGGGAVANGTRVIEADASIHLASPTRTSTLVAAAVATSNSSSSNSSSGTACDSSNVGIPQSVIGRDTNGKALFARARGDKRKRGSDVEGSSSQFSKQLPRNQKKKSRKVGKTPKLGQSILTSRILGPSESGQAGNLNLPWSCAIYSIVNWMVAFPDVEGIQTLCLKVLPFLLEDEQQRMVAQRASLTDVVLRAMVHFPNSVQLHTVAFHAIVLLARPLGGREGMLFHSSMVNASGIFGHDSPNHGGKNGIAVMLDSMQRFQDNDGLQAMSCWSLVNIALAPAQKAVLVKLGGIQATTNAMLRHPHCAEVQFRALFALINLVIPSVRLNANNLNPTDGIPEQQLEEVNDTSEKEVLDGFVGHITSLVVQAMKHFCSSEAILNRACLVLHNLSLTKDYHTTLLWTPNCYQMIEWCLANYQSDQVLQQSASGTLHRLQQTLSTDVGLRNRFAEYIQSQQRDSLEQAHREAMHLHEEHERIERERERQLQIDSTQPPAN